MSNESILKNAAWCFFLTPGHPETPQQYIIKSWLDHGHPKVNLNLLQDVSELWLVDNPIAYGLSIIFRYIKSIPEKVREQIGLDNIVSPHVIIESCVVVDCNKEKALVIRVFDPGYTPRSTLPQNYNWKQINNEESPPTCCKCHKVLTEEETSPKTPNLLVQTAINIGNPEMADLMRQAPNIMQNLAMKCTNCGNWMCIDCAKQAFEQSGKGIIMHSCGGSYVSV